MSASFEGTVTWAYRNRVLVFAGAGVLLALSFIGIRQLTFDSNVLRLLPEHGEATSAFRTFLDRFGTLDDLYVVFTAPPDHTIDEYEDQIASWIAELRTLPELIRVDTGRPDSSRDWRWLLDRELLLLDEERLDKALARLQPDAMATALADARALLTVPSPEIAAMVRDDPFGFHQLLQEQLGSAQAIGLVASGEGYVSEDGTSRLVIARPAQPPYDTDFSHRLIGRLQELAPAIPPGAEPLPPMNVTFAGGHRIAIEAEEVVKRESIINGVGSLALILPMLFIVFRSAWLVVIGALPSAVALLVVLGLLGLGGATLSAAATGASAMLFGLGVDGVVLLYVAYHLAIAEGQDPQSAIRALGGPSASMLLGMWTTAATFLGLLVVDFPSLEQLGLLIGLSMIVCGIMTLLLVPASLPSRAPRRQPRRLLLPSLARFIDRRRAQVLIAGAVITVVLGYFATTLRVNLTLDRLRSVTPGAHMVEEITRAFGLPDDIFVVVAEGQDLQQLLEANEQLASTLRRDLPALALQAPSHLLPSARTQRRRLDRIQNTVTNLGTVLAQLERTSTQAGFKRKTFEQFAHRLPQMVQSDELITWEGFAAHGLEDIIERFVVRTEGGWTLASYAFPATPQQREALRSAVNSISGAGVLSGLQAVNQEMSAGFVPQFAWGLTIGSLIVLASIVVTFRDWRLSLLTLVPTAIGLTWAAGLLGLAQTELDLFSVFAVITFVGIGVDYGIHLVHRFQERGDATAAVAELAPVILVAGGITLFGYGTLIGSSYPPLQSIGVVSAVSVVTLVVASVFVLPALLKRKSE